MYTHTNAHGYKTSTCMHTRRHVEMSHGTPSASHRRHTNVLSMCSLSVPKGTLPPPPPFPAISLMARSHNVRDTYTFVGTSFRSRFFGRVSVPIPPRPPPPTHPMRPFLPFFRFPTDPPHTFDASVASSSLRFREESGTDEREREREKERERGEKAFTFWRLLLRQSFSFCVRIRVPVRVWRLPWP